MAKTRQTRDILADERQATMEQRLEMSLALRDYTNQMRETITRIERMVSALVGLTEGERVALGEVLSAREEGELQAVANLAQLFVTDARAAAPTFLPTPVSASKLP